MPKVRICIEPGFTLEKDVDDVAGFIRHAASFGQKKQPDMDSDIDRRNKLIADQQLEIVEMRELVAFVKSCLDSIVMQIVGIGGPLNDNKRGYTKEQIGDWLCVLNKAESALGEIPNDDGA